jgi:hypothetical protein
MDDAETIRELRKRLATLETAAREYHAAVKHEQETAARYLPCDATWAAEDRLRAASTALERALGENGR